MSVIQHKKRIYFFTLLVSSVIGIIYVLNEIQLRNRNQIQYQQHQQHLASRIARLMEQDSFLLKNRGITYDLSHRKADNDNYQPNTQHSILRLEKLWMEYNYVIERFDYLHKKYSPYIGWKWEGKQHWLRPPQSEYITEQARFIYDYLGQLQKKLS